MAAKTSDDPLLEIFLRQLRRESRNLPGYSSGPPQTVKEVLPHMRLVIQIARRYGPMAASRGLTVMDLVQEGYIGLLNAFKKFDPKRGVKFATYATWWVRARILRAVDNSHHRGVRIPGGRREDLRNLDRAIADLTRKLQRAPSQSEVRDSEAQYGIPREYTAGLMAFASLHAVSMDAPVGDDDGLMLKDTLVATEVSIEDRVVTDWMTAWIKTYVADLEERVRIVIEKRYGLTGDSPCSLQEIADDMEISRERVRQLERDGLTRIRALMAEDTRLLEMKNAQRLRKTRSG